MNQYFPDTRTSPRQVSTFYKSQGIRYNKVGFRWFDSTSKAEKLADQKKFVLELMNHYREDHEIIYVDRLVLLVSDDFEM